MTAPLTADPDPIPALGVSNRPSALVIEDDELIATLIVMVLEELGFRACGIASTEDQAVELASQWQPDLVTADFNLLAGNGVTAVERIRAERWVPVVFVSASCNRAMRDIVGAATVAKPFSIETLALGIAKAKASEALTCRIAGQRKKSADQA